MKSVNGLSEMGLEFLNKQKEKFNKLTKEGGKTLSDEMHTIECTMSGYSFDGKPQVGRCSFIRWIDSVDVKKTIDKIKSELVIKKSPTGCYTQDHIKEVINKHLGDKLVKG